MSGITSHVLDTALGKPAPGIDIELEISADQSSWQSLGSGTTNADGRVPELFAGEPKAGHYRMSFKVSDYFKRQKVESFYSTIRIEFKIDDVSQHYHVPLLLSPFGYSTYRGS